MARLISAAVALLMTWLGALAPSTSASDAAPIPTAIQTYTYDGDHHAALSAGTTTERGPPADVYAYTANAAVDLRSHSPSARRDATGTYGHTTYDHRGRSAQLDSGRATARPSAEARQGDMRSVSAVSVAANAGSKAGQVLKGPIADAIPKNLPQQMTLDAAKQGSSRQIMDNLADPPRLIANYGEGTWVKMQYVLRGNYSNVTVHYFRNLDTGLDVEFKFK